MGVYAYKAVSETSAQVVQGTLAADSAREARERLRSLQGNLAITPSPLGGWRVVMTLPLARPRP